MCGAASPPRRRKLKRMIMKKNDQLFKTYKRRMTLSAVISSAKYGLSLGGIAAFLASLLSWLFEFNQIWVALVVWAVVATVCGVIIYFVIRPDDMKVASRIDSMGLEERTITMMGLEDSDSTIAQLQRSDAIQQIESASHGMIKSSFPIFSLGSSITGATLSVGQSVATYIGLGVAGLAGAGMILVDGLAGIGVFPSPDLDGLNDKENYVTVSYIADDGGFINSASGIGEEQILSPGQNAEPVTAEAEDGWVFVRWSDGSTNPGRTDRNITQNMIYTATFEEIGTGIGGDGDGDSIDSDSDGDYDQNAPESEESQGGGDGNDGASGGEGDGSGDKGEGSGEGDGGQEGTGNGQGQGQGSGGGWSDSNLVIDGDTPYREILPAYIESLMEQLEAGTLPPELVDFIESYMNSL